jgi:hypothetical protein
MIVVAATISPVSAQSRSAQTLRIDRAFRTYWAAPTAAARLKAINAIVASGVSFDEALRRLKSGRPYRPQPSGRRNVAVRIGGKIFRYTLDVPSRYDPARRYPLRIYLHGGVHETARNRRADSMTPFANPESFNLIPLAGGEPWWSERQLGNLRAVLEQLKQRYNIDENRVVLAGESDGGTGAYFVAMRETTPFAAFLPFNSFIMVLGNEGWPLNDRLFPNNLKNKPLFVVNGERDPVYPIDRVDPFIVHMRSNGVKLDYHKQPEAGHDLSWYPELSETIDRFVADHPRNPLPDSLTWERTEDDSSATRAHWLIVDEVSEPSDDDQSQGGNQISRFTVRRGGANPYPLFVYQPPAGRADAVRSGNTIKVTAEGVAEVTLLLSPDQIDFTGSLTVVVNDETIFDGQLEPPDLKTMLKWAAKDNDRTMLFGAEFHVHLD